MLIKPEKTFAVAVDYQEKLMPAIAHNSEIIDTSVKLLKGLKLLGVDIYVTQQYTKGLGSTVEEIKNASEMKDHVEKLNFGACEDLSKLIAPPNEKPYVLMCGTETHVCVLQTAIGLKEAGYQPVFVTDCIGSRKDEDKAIALERAKQEGILLTSCESILFELLHDSKNSAFKQISNLVK